MKVNIDNKIYDVIVKKKNNKNTYIRVTPDLEILVTTNYLASNRHINDLIKKNDQFIRKMIDKRLKEKEKETSFYYLGKKYDIIIVPTMVDIDLWENKIYVKSQGYLNKWLNRQVKEIFKGKLDEKYSLFEEKIPYPKLKMRKMKTRWGVCNRKNLSITLNNELVRLNEEKIDYVIVHELAHLVHFDHSKEFWRLVGKYYPNYKIVRRSMRE